MRSHHPTSDSGARSASEPGSWIDAHAASRPLPHPAGPDPGPQRDPPQLRAAGERRPPPAPAGRAILTAVALGIVYFLLSQLGYLAAFRGDVASPVWPDAGITLWVVWRWGVRFLPALAIADLLSNLKQGQPWGAGIGMALAAILEPTLAALLLRRVAAFDARLERVRDVIALVALAAVLSTAVGATLGAASLCWGAGLPWSEFGRQWRLWWAGDLIGVATVAPVLLSWTTGARSPTGSRRAELAALAFATVIVAFTVFGGAVRHHLPIGFLLFPVVVWSALRFGPRETSIALFLIAIVAVWGTLRGAGPLGGMAPSIALLVLQSFVLVLSATGLVFAAASATRRRSDEETRSALSLLSATLDSTADGILVVNTAGTIRTYNRRFVEMWRIPDHIVASRDDRKAIEFVLSQLADPELFLSKVEELYARPSAESFDVLVFKDGRIFERVSLPQWEGGRSVGRVWSFRDVTAQRRLEHELRHSQKMEAVGRLAGGVAHDFNNLLTVVLGYCEMLVSRARHDDTLSGGLREIRRAAERAATLTRQLLAFGRKQVLEPRVLDLNTVLRESEPMLRSVVGEKIEMTSLLEPGLGRVRADPGQLQQVILNLALNARDAMPTGGRLTLVTAGVELDEQGVRGQLALQPGRYVTLAVTDTGVGIDPAAQVHVFEPFFTTKEGGKGTGLGLAMVYGILKQSGGDIALTSEPGHGSTFKVFLPWVDEPAPEEPVAPIRPRGHGREAVLLVEDEDGVRRLERLALESQGYLVLEATRGSEALEMATRFTEHLHILVTDVVMPGIGGRELADSVRGIHPEARVLYLSGYADDEVLREGVRQSVAAFLDKPFSPETLVARVREVLDAEEPSPATPRP